MTGVRSAGVCMCLWASPWVCNSEFVFMYMHVFVLFCACLSGSLGFCVYVCVCVCVCTHVSPHSQQQTTYSHTEMPLRQPCGADEGLGGHRGQGSVDS